MPPSIQNSKLKIYHQLLLLLFLVVITTDARSQSGWYLGPTFAFHGVRELYAEAGAGIIHVGNIRGHGMLPDVYGLNATVEARLDRDMIIAPQVTVWGTAAILSGAISAGAYTDFDRSSFFIKPQIGFGMLTAQIMYGHNILLTNREMKGINSHELCVRLLIPVIDLDRSRSQRRTPSE